MPALVSVPASVSERVDFTAVAVSDVSTLLLLSKGSPLFAEARGLGRDPPTDTSVPWSA